VNSTDPKRPRESGRFVLSDDGRTVRLSDGATPADPEKEPRPNWWLRALLVWFVGLGVVYVWWQVDAGQCIARVAASCADRACGPDAGWGCGLGGAFVIVLWVAVLAVGVAAAGIAWLVRLVRPTRDVERPG
jgi:hypothetical protein